MKNNKDNVKIKTDYVNDKKSIFLKVIAYCNLSLSQLNLANILDPDNDIAIIDEFDMI